MSTVPSQQPFTSIGLVPTHHQQQSATQPRHITSQPAQRTFQDVMSQHRLAQSGNKAGGSVPQSSGAYSQAAQPAAAHSQYPAQARAQTSLQPVPLSGSAHPAKRSLLEALGSSLVQSATATPQQALTPPPHGSALPHTQAQQQSSPQSGIGPQVSPPLLIGTPTPAQMQQWLQSVSARSQHPNSLSAAAQVGLMPATSGMPTPQAISMGTTINWPLYRPPAVPLPATLPSYRQQTAQQPVSMPQYRPNSAPHPTNLQRPSPPRHPYPLVTTPNATPTPLSLPTVTISSPPEYRLAEAQTQPAKLLEAGSLESLPKVSLPVTNTPRPPTPHSLPSPIPIAGPPLPYTSNPQPRPSPSPAQAHAAPAQQVAYVQSKPQPPRPPQLQPAQDAPPAHSIPAPSAPGPQQDHRSTPAVQNHLQPTVPVSTPSAPGTTDDQVHDKSLSRDPAPAAAAAAALSQPGATSAAEPLLPTLHSYESQDWHSRPVSRAATPTGGGNPPSPNGLKAAKSLLSQLLSEVILGVQKRVPQERLLQFQQQVNKATVPDYSRFVHPDKEIWLKKIATKVRRQEYIDSAQLCSDYDQLHDNAKAYNSPECGSLGTPVLVEWAAEIVHACYDEVNDRWKELGEAESRLAEELQRAPEDAGLHIALPALPMPSHFQKIKKVSERKPLGWIEFTADCPAPGHQHSPRMDRIDKVAEFMGKHASCRPEWNDYARQPAESDDRYRLRLKRSFNFSNRDGDANVKVIISPGIDGIRRSSGSGAASAQTYSAEATEAEEEKPLHLLAAVGEIARKALRTYVPQGDGPGPSRLSSDVHTPTSVEHSASDAGGMGQEMLPMPTEDSAGDSAGSLQPVQGLTALRRARISRLQPTPHSQGAQPNSPSVSAAAAAAAGRSAPDGVEVAIAQADGLEALFLEAAEEAAEVVSHEKAVDMAADQAAAVGAAIARAAAAEAEKANSEAAEWDTARNGASSPAAKRRKLTPEPQPSSSLQGLELPMQRSPSIAKEPIDALMPDALTDGQEAEQQGHDIFQSLSPAELASPSFAPLDGQEAEQHGHTLLQPLSSAELASPAVALSSGPQPDGPQASMMRPPGQQLHEPPLVLEIADDQVDACQPTSLPAHLPEQLPSVYKALQISRTPHSAPLPTAALRPQHAPAPTAACAPAPAQHTSSQPQLQQALSNPTSAPRLDAKQAAQFIESLPPNFSMTPEQLGLIAAKFSQRQQQRKQQQQQQQPGQQPSMQPAMQRPQQPGQQPTSQPAVQRTQQHPQPSLHQTQTAAPSNLNRSTGVAARQHATPSTAMPHSSPLAQSAERQHHAALQRVGPNLQPTSAGQDPAKLARPPSVHGSRLPLAQTSQPQVPLSGAGRAAVQMGGSMPETSRQLTYTQPILEAHQLWATGQEHLKNAAQMFEACRSRAMAVESATWQHRAQLEQAQKDMAFNKDVATTMHQKTLQLKEELRRKGQDLVAEQMKTKTLIENKRLLEQRMKELAGQLKTAKTEGVLEAGRMQNLKAHHLRIVEEKQAVIDAGQQRLQLYKAQVAQLQSAAKVDSAPSTSNAPGDPQTVTLARFNQLAQEKADNEKVIASLQQQLESQKLTFGQPLPTRSSPTHATHTMHGDTPTAEASVSAAHGQEPGPASTSEAQRTASAELQQQLTKTQALLVVRDRAVQSLQRQLRASQLQHDNAAQTNSAGQQISWQEHTKQLQDAQHQYERATRETSNLRKIVEATQKQSSTIQGQLDELRAQHEQLQTRQHEAQDKAATELAAAHQQGRRDAESIEQLKGQVQPAHSHSMQNLHWELNAMSHILQDKQVSPHEKLIAAMESLGRAREHLYAVTGAPAVSVPSVITLDDSDEEGEVHNNGALGNGHAVQDHADAERDVIERREQKADPDGDDAAWWRGSSG